MKRDSSILAALGLAVQLALSVEWFRGIRKMPVLGSTDDASNLEQYPSLSVIVPARDEERAVGEGVGSALIQDYPGDLEVIAIDDRSADRTAEILDRLNVGHLNLRVFHVKDLPEGWLGKNHALYLGAREAAGDWLLFTDADVRFSPRCFKEAVGYAARNGLDHLTLFPEIVSRGALLEGFVAVFAWAFLMGQRPWRAGEPGTKEHVGIGAFNLIRRKAYKEIGTHRAIAMRPDDDLKLAKLVKKHGFKQGAAFGTELLGVEWHQSLKGAVRGLSKSIFPGVDYRLDTLAYATLLLLLTNVLPFAGLVFAARGARILFGINVLLIFTTYRYQAGYSKVKAPLWGAALHPLSVCIWICAMWRSACVTLANDGIEWRGTKYPLKSLKANIL